MHIFFEVNSQIRANVFIMYLLGVEMEILSKIKVYEFGSFDIVKDVILLQMVMYVSYVLVGGRKD